MRRGHKEVLSLIKNTAPLGSRRCNAYAYITETGYKHHAGGQKSDHLNSKKANGIGYKMSQYHSECTNIYGSGGFYVFTAPDSQYGHSECTGTNRQA